MSTTIPHFASDTDRATIYRALHPQVIALLEGETDAVAAMANLSAAVHQAFGHHWTGFYRVVGKELVLGPFQGPVACARIGFGKGVCGAAWELARTVIVPDVEKFPGHIACSPLSRSEIVVPLRGRGGAIAAVLDIDSVELDAFGSADAEGLERLVRAIEPLLA
jgi:GAF domain-containing protein